MTIVELQWLVGIAVTVMLGVGGIAFTAFRAVSGRLDGDVGEMRNAVKAGDDQLHERINRVRQDVSDNYVRRVDLESHMKRHDDTQKEMRDDVKAILQKIAGIEARQTH